MSLKDQAVQAELEGRLKAFVDGLSYEDTLELLAETDWNFDALVAHATLLEVHRIAKEEGIIPHG